VNVVADTVWDMLTAYVPAPPGVPVSCEVIMVPAVTPVPVRTMPDEKVPTATAKTVKVVPEMVDPVEVVVAVVPAMVEAVLVAPGLANTAPVTTAFVAIAATVLGADAVPWLTM